MSDKKSIIGLKVRNEDKQRILGRCNDLKCNTTEYIKRLIDRDLTKSEDKTYRISIEGDKLILPCWNCDGPVPFNLKDLGLTRL